MSSSVYGQMFWASRTVRKTLSDGNRSIVFCLSADWSKLESRAMIVQSIESVSCMRCLGRPSVVEKTTDGPATERQNEFDKACTRPNNS